MAIITISRGSYSKGKEVAEKVAERLGYECIAREVLMEASEYFNIPEIKLVRALHDAPSVLERFTYGKEKYLAFIEAAILDRLRRDDVVYHGLAGHFFLKGVNHVLKIRILADMEDRVRLEMDRESIPRDEALHVLKKDDHERRQWSLNLFGSDSWDPSLYDLVIHIHKITVEDAVNIICQTAQSERFRTTVESQKVMDDLVLASRVKTALIDACPSVRVHARDGVAYVHVSGGPGVGEAFVDDLKERAKTVPAVKEVVIEVSPASAFFPD
jgi:cytidylate kinase